MPQTATYKWELHNLLGAGSFGYVYKVLSYKHYKLYTCILLWSIFTFFRVQGPMMKLSLSKHFVVSKNQMLHEVNMMSALNHENIVKFVDFETIQGTTSNALIMELCDHDVETIIEQNTNGLETSEVIEFCTHLVNAIQHLRKHNIVHRDIKPGNIMRCVRQNQSFFKLSDFGSARVLKPNKRYGSVYGTFEYMHPDVFANLYGRALEIKLQKDPLCDVHELWSVGATIYQVVSGQLPFEVESGREDPRKMYEMIAQKGAQSISAKQINGEVIWSDNLPTDCLMNDSLKTTITPFLAGLLKVYLYFKCTSNPLRL